jgi:hypothetical protein
MNLLVDRLSDTSLKTIILVDTVVGTQFPNNLIPMTQSLILGFGHSFIL